MGCIYSKLQSPKNSKPVQPDIREIHNIESVVDNKKYNI